MNQLRNLFVSPATIKTALLLFLIIGFIQSVFTAIGLDEAYYWFFAQDLDWGYFDHPPMVALMIAIGNSFLPDVFGVRFMTIVFSLLTYYIIWLLIPEENRKKEGSVLVFFLLISTSPLLVIYSFITTPDVPLIFFSALYLFLFQRFAEKQTLNGSLLLGLVMACLIYSKYHGILVILITVLSRPSLFKSPLFYLAGLTGVILYFPHLYWQYQHDFVSFEYHLSYRSVMFQWKNVFTYILNVILILNPLLFPVFVFQYFRRVNKTAIHRMTFSTLIWSFLIFFGFTSFRGHVEPQWIAVVTIPMIVYLHQYAMNSERLKKTLVWISGICLVLILTARIVLMLPLPLKSEFHLWTKKDFETIQKLAKGKTVVFANSYTMTSRYSFYTGDPAYSYNFVSFRKNQYDLLEDFRELDGQEICFVTTSDLGGYTAEYLPNGERIKYKFIRNARIINQLHVNVLEYDKSMDGQGVLNVKFEVYNPYDEVVEFQSENGEQNLTWSLYFFYPDKERVKPAAMIPAVLPVLSPKSTTVLTLGFQVDLLPGEYTFGMHVNPPEMFPVSVSKRTYPLTFH